MENNDVFILMNWLKDLIEQEGYDSFNEIGREYNINVGGC